jgi:general secretion pathway protein A
MYQEFYGLRELPFELAPNSKYLFLTPRHREALSALEYGLSSAKAITLLLGEVGTGKTTLIRAALESESCRHVNCVYLNNPALTRSEFIETLAARFGLDDRAASSKAVLLDALEGVLLERRAKGMITALVVDEAQSLSAELLEEIRLLANTETTTHKLLPVVLAGQPELKDRLNEPRLRQLKQRVTLRCEILPFTAEETSAYVSERVAVAGGDAATMFTREAVTLIHQFSGGLPRSINVICDNALLTSFGLGRRPVTRETVLEVARDFDLVVVDRRSAAVPAVPAVPLVAPGPGNLALVPGRASVIAPQSPGIGSAESESEEEPAPPKRRFFSWFRPKPPDDEVFIVTRPRLFSQFR